MRTSLVPRTLAQVLAVGVVVVSACGRSEAPPPPPSPGAVSPNAALIARARSLELETPYVPPPGDPLEYHTAGFAKIMCSAVFIVGLDPGFAAENVGYFTSPYDARKRVSMPIVSRASKTVSVSIPSGPTITAKYFDDQGCVVLPRDGTEIQFTPRKLVRGRSPAGMEPWPMGDAPGPAALAPLPTTVDDLGIQHAIDAAFEPAAEMTAAFVVTWKGRIIAERYADGITKQTPLESWSMGKSITATLLGILIEQGVYELTQSAPIPEWQSPGDARAKIRIADILNMSSGLRIRAPQDPDYDPAGPYPDHLYLYTGGVDTFHYAATRPLQWPPGQVGRYHNTDPVLINHLIRRAVEKRGEDYLSFPQRALFDRLGVRTAVLEPDAFGNLLIQGYDYMSARDWARLGNLYLQDGVWQGERILPEGFVTFASTVAPAWQADGRPIYGGFFWINGDGAFPIPKDAYYMAGAGGQNVFVIPSHDLVVVRLGHYKGSTVGQTGLVKALSLLTAAVPQRPTP